MSQNTVMKHSPKAFKGHWIEGNDIPLQDEQFFCLVGFVLFGQLMTGVILWHDCKEMLTAISTKKEEIIKLRQAWENTLGFTCRRKIRWQQMNFLSAHCFDSAPRTAIMPTDTHICIFSACARLNRDPFPCSVPCFGPFMPGLILLWALWRRNCFSLPPSCKVPDW